MDYIIKVLEQLVELTSTVIWPIIVCVIIIMLRKEIRSISIALSERVINAKNIKFTTSGIELQDDNSIVLARKEMLVQSLEKTLREKDEQLAKLKVKGEEPDLKHLQLLEEKVLEIKIQLETLRTINVDILERKLHHIESVSEVETNNFQKSRLEAQRKNVKKELDNELTTLESEALRKLKIFCNSEYCDDDIREEIFSSDTYGVVGISQVQQEIMIRKGWIEIVDMGKIRITELGKTVALKR